MTYLNEHEMARMVEAGYPLCFTLTQTKHCDACIEKYRRELSTPIVPTPSACDTMKI